MPMMKILYSILISNLLKILDHIILLLFTSVEFPFRLDTPDQPIHVHDQVFWSNSPHSWKRNESLRGESNIKTGRILFFFYILSQSEGFSAFPWSYPKHFNHLIYKNTSKWSMLFAECFMTTD